MRSVWPSLGVCCVGGREGVCVCVCVRKYTCMYICGYRDGMYMCTLYIYMTHTHACARTHTHTGACFGCGRSYFGRDTAPWVCPLCCDLFILLLLYYYYYKSSFLFLIIIFYHHLYFFLLSSFIMVIMIIFVSTLTKLNQHSNTLTKLNHGHHDHRRQCSFLLHP
jgi:hypothetical protein